MRQLRNTRGQYTTQKQLQFENRVKLFTVVALVVGVLILSTVSI